jgi:putative NIF3 family GTP cyclohydrolase 1 type 2
VKIIEVVDALERFAPLPLQEDYDNAGLQVGLTEAEVSGALLCLDVTEAVLDEAIEKGCNLIVSHHPLIFHKLSHLTGDDYVQRVVMKADNRFMAVMVSWRHSMSLWLLTTSWYC